MGEPVPRRRRFLINWVLPIVVVSGLGGGLGAVIQFTPILNPFDPGDSGRRGLPPIVAEWMTQLPPMSDWRARRVAWNGPHVARGAPLIEAAPVALDPDEAPPLPVALALPPVSPLQAMAMWLDAVQTGPCSAVQITSLSTERVELLAFGQDPAPFLQLIAAFTGVYGVEPEVVLQPVSTGQCALISQLPRHPGPVRITLEADSVAVGAPLSGAISGLAGADLWLGLVDGDGRVWPIGGAVDRLSADAARFVSAAPALGQAEVGGQVAPMLIVAFGSDPNSGLSAGPDAAPVHAVAYLQVASAPAQGQ